MRKNGFTLTELLAVIALLAVITLMVAPNLLKTYQTTRKNSMKVQEERVVDAANLYVEDRCTKRIDGSLECPSSYKTTVNDQKYVCLRGVQEDKYIGKVSYGNTECNGVIIYTKNDKGRFNIGKAYLYCGSDYITDSSLDKSKYNCGL